MCLFSIKEYLIVKPVCMNFYSVRKICLEKKRKEKKETEMGGNLKTNFRSISSSAEFNRAF